ncbi:MAG: serine/threonine-protein phosphatase, partial [Proteobacteria bacterium]|nr:serine/threonine-protein phosphatase [Pseudomonadota bacterium]
LLFSGGRPPDCLRTPNPLVGGIPSARYAGATTSIGQGDRLVVFSDGCYEITRKDGSLWTLDAFSAYVADKGKSLGLDDLIRHTRGLSASDSYEDDFSILEVRFS